MRLLNLLSITALALLSLGLAGCDDDHHLDPTVYIQDGVLFNTPPGGENFGTAMLYNVLESSKSISSFSDADGFDLFLNDPALLVITAKGFDGLNPLVELYDTDGAFVAGDEGSFAGDEAALLVGPVDPGLYTVVVWSTEFGGTGNGNYDLTVLVSDDNGGDFEEIDIDQSLTVNNQAIGANGATASWAFTLTEDSKVSIDVLAALGTDLGFQLLDETGVEVDNFNMAGDTINWTSPLLFKGTYLLILDGGDMGPATTYDLTIGAEAVGP